MDDDPLRIGQQHQHRRVCCSRRARGRPEATTELDRVGPRGMRVPDDLDVTGPQADRRAANGEVERESEPDRDQAETALPYDRMPLSQSSRDRWAGRQARLACRGFRTLTLRTSVDSVAVVPTSPESMRRWTRVEYDRLIDLGIFQPGEHLELLGGHLIVSEPQGTLHTTAVGLVEDALRLCFGAGWVVRCQMPIALDDESEPEPDVAVVPGTRYDYVLAHPARPALVVEVAESSLTADRGTKAALYARAGINDYWILNLVDRVLEVCRALWRALPRDRDRAPRHVDRAAGPSRRAGGARCVAAAARRLPQMTPSRRSVSIPASS